MNEADSTAGHANSVVNPPVAKSPTIGGWLVVVGIGLALGLLENLSNLGYAISTTRRVWTRLTNPGSSAYHPYWKTVLVYDVISAGLLVILNVIAVILFRGKRRPFPKFMALGIPAVFLLSFGGYFLESFIPAAVATTAHAKESHDMIIRFVAMHVWVPYFLLSKRVKQTFVL